MNISLKILEADSKISDLIKQQIQNKLTYAINQALPNISSEIKYLVAQSLRNQPEYISLMSGKLKAEFGIPDSNKINSVIDGLVNTIQTNSTPISINNRGVNGGFTITMIKSDDLSGLIYTDIASVIDDSGYTLPWLEWLTLKGNQIIVKKYDVVYGSSPTSRSGLAIMEPSTSNWRVPPEFSGTKTDNWITRAIDKVEKEIYQIIQKNIEKYL